MSRFVKIGNRLCNVDKVHIIRMIYLLAPSIEIVWDNSTSATIMFDSVNAQNEAWEKLVEQINTMSINE